MAGTLNLTALGNRHPKPHGEPYEGNAVLGASGEICVDIQGNPWNKVIPIVKYAASGTPQVVAREYPADNGKPVTVPCDIPKNG